MTQWTTEAVELELVAQAHKRNNAKPLARRDIPHMMTGLGSVEPHIVGLRGEWAFARLLGLQLDRGLYVVGDRSDFGGFEIKTSTFDGPWQRVALKIKREWLAKDDVHTFVLARNPRSDPHRVDLLGAIGREGFLRYAEETTFQRDNPCLAMYAEGLFPFDVYFHDHLRRQGATICHN